MPKGFDLPTNKEMQREWAEDSLRVYQEALQGVVASFTEHPRQAAWLHGKPLNALQFGFVQTPTKSLDFSSAMTQEVVFLGVRNLGEELGCTTEDGLSDEARAKVTTSIRSIGEIVLAPNLEVSMVQDPTAVGAEYDVSYGRRLDSRGREYIPRRATSTFYGRPSKMHLAMARGFSDVVKHYITTEDFQKFPLGLTATQLQQRLAATDGDRVGHVVRVRMIPGLPLNGSESDRFLLSYHNKMQAQRLAEEREIAIREKYRSVQGTMSSAALHEAKRDAYAASENGAWAILQQRMLGADSVRF